MLPVKTINCNTVCFMIFAGISNVKSREDLVMSNTDLSTIADPFGAAPFPAKNTSTFV